MTTQDNQESIAQEKFLSAIDSALAEAIPILHWGDGYGGHLKDLFIKRVDSLFPHKDNSPIEKTYKKEKIGIKLKTLVFERDAYRCVFCDSHKSLTLDHIYPERLGGKSSFENLQTLCKSCNSKKGVSI